MRKVILHYHLFKNAGTSVDVLLEQGFPGRWVTREFPVDDHEVNVNHVGLWIQTFPDAVVFSSHTALMPPPVMPRVECFPIVFVRHPLDRLASVYAFERKQGGGEFGAVLARNTSLAGYVETRLAMPYDRQCRNFHAWRLAQLFSVDEGSDAERAMRAIDALPFVGLVECFDGSVLQMVAWLKPHFPTLEAKAVTANVTRDHSVTLADRLKGIQAELGSGLYKRVLEANADDLAIHEAVGRRYGN